MLVMWKWREVESRLSKTEWVAGSKSLALMPWAEEAFVLSKHEGSKTAYRCTIHHGEYTPRLTSSSLFLRTYVSIFHQPLRICVCSSSALCLTLSASLPVHLPLPFCGPKLIDRTTNARPVFRSFGPLDWARPRPLENGPSYPLLSFPTDESHEHSNSANG